MSNRRLKQLERLGRLRQSGLLTTIEYEAEKRRLFDDAGGGRSLGRTGWVVAAAAAGSLAAAWFFWPEVLAIMGTPSHQLPAAAAPEAKQAAQVSPTPTAAPDTPVLPSLDRVLTFKDPRKCEFGPTLGRLFTAMWHWSERDQKIVGGGDVRIAELNTTARASFSRVPHKDGTVEFDSSLPLAGTWYGLKVDRLMSGGLEASDQVGWQIHFDESPERIRSVLNEHGFDLPSPGKYRSVAAGEQATAVMPLKQGAVFTCSPNL